MPVLFDELHQLLENPDYSRFMLTNLHLHTPATASDWDGWSNQTHAAADVTPEIYFQHLNATSLELAAITDHNTVSWCAPLIQIAKQARKQELSRIHILPGVEITTYEGPHLVALFDEGQDVGDIHKMLTRLGISGQGGTDDAAGRATVGREVVINEIIDEVSGLNGIIIAPHVHTKDGLWGHKEFKGRYNILNDPRLRLLAAPSGDIKRVEDPTGRTRLLYKNMGSSKVTNSFGFLQGLSSADVIEAAGSVKLLFLPIAGSIAVYEFASENWHWTVYWSPFYWAYKANNLILSRTADWGTVLLSTAMVLGLSLIVFFAALPKIRKGLS